MRNALGKGNTAAVDENRNRDDVQDEHDRGDGDRRMLRSRSAVSHARALRKDDGEVRWFACDVRHANACSNSEGGAWSHHRDQDLAAASKRLRIRFTLSEFHSASVFSSRASAPGVSPRAPWAKGVPSCESFFMAAVTASVEIVALRN